MSRLDLPPPYDETALSADGDAFDHACAVAGEAGGGALVWARRSDRVDLAVVLEPAEALNVARQVVFAGLNAAADALAAVAPPEKPLALRWPDALLFDGGLIGGVRLAWPDSCAEDAVPDWLVLGLGLRVAFDDVPDGRAPAAALIAEGFDDFEVPAFIASFARHLMAALDEWATSGPASQFARWRRRWEGGAEPVLDDLADRLAVPSWYDVTSGEIRA